MDSILISVFKNIFQSVCDEMGKILQFSAFSSNIKERQDFSCALFTADGESFAFGSHIPVHLGAMPLSVQTAVKETNFRPGDVVILNDPFRGGTHLPDITLIAPLFVRDEILFYVANRAHHSDIGGIKAGSMPLASEIYQEGLVLPPVKIIRGGRLDEDIFNVIQANVRNPEMRRGDLMAQIAANRRGIFRLNEIIKKYGKTGVIDFSRSLIDYTEDIFKDLISEMPDGIFSFVDVLDDDGFGNRDISIDVKIEIHGSRLTIDFSGSSPQVKGGVNTSRAVTCSAVLYVLTTLLDEDIPINSGIMRPVQLVIPSGCILDAVRPASLAAGNVETSQRICDVLFGALAQAMPDRIPAASQGTMNNISSGSSGFSYYETLAGGSGAGPNYNGISAVHSHMTNSLNTPVEALERDFPVCIENYRLRKGSGGNGKFRGGDGLERSYRFLEDCQVSILSERRKHAPYGLAGGRAGKRGENILRRNGRRIRLGSKVNLEIYAGDLLTIKTPGGGGYGEKE